MSEENNKLEKVQKSCKTVMIVTRIVCIMFICATVLSFVSGLGVIAKRDHIDSSIPDNVKVKLDSNLILNSPLESDVPSLQAFFDENQASYGLRIGFACFLFTAILAVMAVAVSILSSMFGVIVKEGNPFADKVIKKMLTSLIIISVVFGLTSGLGTGILLGLITWAIYTIMDYGRVLRIQSDETL